jgi:hypothetical protein
LTHQDAWKGKEGGKQAGDRRSFHFSSKLARGGLTDRA